MAKVSYFQRYSQHENHATNNTLLVARYFYQDSPRKLEQILRDVFEEELSLGLEFTQQVHGEYSVPDALIQQAAVRIYFETKLGLAVDEDQIKRHVDSIVERRHSAEREILVALTKEPLAEPECERLRKYANESGVTFKAITFSQMLSALRNSCADYEARLLEIADDYESYLEDEELLDDRDDRIAVFPCGTSFRENQKYSLYYEGLGRPSKRGCRYIGIYTNKVISLVGEIDAVLACSWANGDVRVDAVELGEAKPEYMNRIREVIEGTTYYDLKNEPLRFYLSTEFYPTEFRKESKYGILRVRTLRISETLNDDQRSSAEELAQRLNGKTFE